MTELPRGYVSMYGVSAANDSEFDVTPEGTQSFGKSFGVSTGRHSTDSYDIRSPYGGSPANEIGFPSTPAKTSRDRRGVSFDDDELTPEAASGSGGQNAFKTGRTISGIPRREPFLASDEGDDGSPHDFVAGAVAQPAISNNFVVVSPRVFKDEVPPGSLTPPKIHQGQVSGASSRSALDTERLITAKSPSESSRSPTDTIRKDGSD